MRPQDLKLAQLKAIPLEEYDGIGYHNKTNYAICDDDVIPEIECEDITCDECCLSCCVDIEARIKELETK
jgi:hypothetical protein